MRKAWLLSLTVFLLGASFYAAPSGGPTADTKTMLWYSGPQAWQGRTSTLSAAKGVFIDSLNGGRPPEGYTVEILPGTHTVTLRDSYEVLFHWQMLWFEASPGSHYQARRFTDHFGIVDEAAGEECGTVMGLVIDNMGLRIKNSNGDWEYLPDSTLPPLGHSGGEPFLRVPGNKPTPLFAQAGVISLARAAELFGYPGVGNPIRWSAELQFLIVDQTGSPMPGQHVHLTDQKDKTTGDLYSAPGFCLLWYQQKLYAVAPSKELTQIPLAAGASAASLTGPAEAIRNALAEKGVGRIDEARLFFEEAVHGELSFEIRGRDASGKSVIVRPDQPSAFGGTSAPRSAKALEAPPAPAGTKDAGPTASKESVYSSLTTVGIRDLVKKWGIAVPGTDLSVDEQRQAAAKEPEATPQSFEPQTIGGAAVIVETTMGLMWSVKIGKSLEFTEAKKWIKQLNDERYAGYSDWRLPTAEEGASLMTREPKNIYNFRFSSGKTEPMPRYSYPLFPPAMDTIWSGDRYQRDDSPVAPPADQDKREVWTVSFSNNWVMTSSPNNTCDVIAVRNIR